MKQDSSVKHFTRGGQITLHNMRMFMQVSNKIVLVSIIVFLITTLPLSWILVTDYERYVVGKYIYSTFIPALNPKAATNFTEPTGRVIRVTFAEINRAALTKKVIQNVSAKIIKAMVVGLLFAMITVFGITFWLKRRGRSQSEDEYVRGDTLSSKEVTKEIVIKEKAASDLKLGGLPLIKNGEIMHFLFHGTTRSGKSNAIKELLEQIRQRGDRAIIYDKSCNLLQEFYQPERDVLLNPLDVRGQCWDLWGECRDAADFDQIAAAQIPLLSTLDPFWINAARTIFSSTAYQMRDDPKRSILKLLRYILSPDLNLIQKYLKGTEAESLMSEKTEKTSICIKSTLAIYIKSLRYIREGDNAFSIRQWIHHDKRKQWLFLTSLGDRHETLRPLLTCWLDIAVNTLLSLPPDESRRIWFIFDELYSLHKLPNLENFLSEAGKFGGCAVIGIQSYPQLEEVYGEKGAKVISSLLNTRCFFRQPEPTVAQWSAMNFGEIIKEELKESTSYGANSMRDGISINRVETRNPLISYSEMMSLGNLQSYVRLPGKFPVTPVDFIYCQRIKRHPGFQLRHTDDISIQEVDGMIDQARQAGILLSKDVLEQIYVNDQKQSSVLVDKRDCKNNQEPQHEHALDI